MHLWDDDCYLTRYKLGKLKRALIEWYSYLVYDLEFGELILDVDEDNSMTGENQTEGDNIIRSVLGDEEFHHKEYKKFVEQLCVEFRKINVECGLC